MKGLFIAASVLLIASAHAIGSLVGFDHTDVKPNSYIVVLKSDISNAALYSHRKRTDQLLGLNGNFQKSDFDVGGFRGYHLLAPKSIAEQLAESDEVAYIEADRILRLDAPEPPTPHKAVSRVVQPNAPWGLARISHRKAGSTEYVFEENTGTYVYILDTGVRITHELFEGRASYGFNAVGGSDDDLNGHGTHVAGIASSKTYGVVRFANIISVKVLDDTGSTSTSVLITGINWAVQDIKDKSRVGNSTALLALGGSKSTALNQAVAAGSSQGLFFAVSAGQSNADASNYSPASEPTACTVGSTTIGDARKSSSNYGAVVDIYAPGDSIPSLGISNDTAITVLSGTSMSAAYIAGLGAYFLALEGPRPAVDLCERLKEVATKNVLSGIPAGSWNLLAYNLSGL